MRGKRVCAALLSAALLLGLTGCHGSKETARLFQVPDTFDESQTYEITFWAKTTPTSSRRTSTSRPLPTLSSCTPTSPSTLRLYTDYGDIYNDVITNISTGTTPDVCITYPDHIATYLTGDNVVVPLDELFADPDYGLGGSALKFDSPTQEEIIPQFLEECDLNGTYARCPTCAPPRLATSTRPTVEAGLHPSETLTWDFIWEVSMKPPAKERRRHLPANGQNGDDSLYLQSTDNMMIQMLRLGAATPPMEEKSSSSTIPPKAAAHHRPARGDGSLFHL